VYSENKRTTWRLIAAGTSSAARLAPTGCSGQRA
jgi:hypothetical protein